MLVTIVDDLLIGVIVNGSDKKRGSAVDGCYKMIISGKSPAKIYQELWVGTLGVPDGNSRGWRICVALQLW